MRHGESLPVPRSAAIGKRGTRMHHGALECTNDVLVRIALAIWPKKTAENWSGEAGCKPRIVKYWLAGTRPISADGRLALIRQIS